MANPPQPNRPDPHENAPHENSASGIGRGTQIPADETLTVRVRFPDFQTARGAIEDMERGGLDGANMAFDGASLQRAAQSVESGARDDRFLQRAVRNLGLGALIGLGVGLVAGVGLGVSLFGDAAAAVVGTAVAVTAAGGLVGAALGGIWGHEQSPAWEDTFEAPDAGEAVLHIELHRAEEVDLVRDVASRHDAVVQ